MKKTIFATLAASMVAGVVALAAPAAEAANVKIINHTQVGVTAITYDGTDDPRKSHLRWHATPSAPTVEIASKYLTRTVKGPGGKTHYGTLEIGVNFINSGNSAERHWSMKDLVTTTGHTVTATDTIHINVWQQAVGYYVPSTDVYTKDGDWVGKLP